MSKRGVIRSWPILSLISLHCPKNQSCPWCHASQEPFSYFTTCVCWAQCSGPGGKRQLTSQQASRGRCAAPPDLLGMASHFHLRASFMDSEKDSEFFFQTVTPFEVMHPSDCAPTTKNLFCTCPSVSANQRKILMILHFYSPMKSFAQCFKVQALILCVQKQHSNILWNDTFLPSNIPFCLCRIFF